MGRINCPLCLDRGFVPVENPVEAEIDGIEFDYMDKVPCPVCPAGFRMQLGTEAKVRQMDREEG